MTDATSPHDAVLCLDTHVDIPWPEPPDPRALTRRCVDYPKMVAGGMNAVVFAAYLPQGPLTAEGHAAAADRAEAMLRSIRATAEGAGRRIARSADEVEAAFKAGETAVLLAVENGYGLGDSIDGLASWRDLGICYLTLTHNGHNLLSDSAIPLPSLGDTASRHGGLSALGEAAVARMNELGILVDVSHVAKSGMMQAVALSRTPVVATHTCCRALRDHPRNLDDEQLDALKASGGLAQMTAVPAFLRDADADGRYRARVADIVDHVDYAVRRIGLEHVGLSSDFDGGGGVEGWRNAAETGNVTAELTKRGYDPAQIGLLWSGNFLRLMRQAEAMASA